MGFEPMVDSTGGLVKMIVRTCAMMSVDSLEFRTLISDQVPEVGMCIALKDSKTGGRSGSWPLVKTDFTLYWTLVMNRAHPRMAVVRSAYPPNFD